VVEERKRVVGVEVRKQVGEVMALELVEVMILLVVVGESKLETVEEVSELVEEVSELVEEVSGQEVGVNVLVVVVDKSVMVVEESELVVVDKQVMVEEEMVWVVEASELVVGVVRKLAVEGNIQGVEVVSIPAMEANVLVLVVSTLG